MAKSFLEKNHITFQDLDVSTDKAARDEMISKSGQMGVPVIDIGGEITVGFNETLLKQKLGI